VKTPRHFILALAFAASLVSCCFAQQADDYEQPPINYSKSKPHDVISHLSAASLIEGLKTDATDREVVVKLLRTLHVPVASQLLVFSKTSFQNDRINPSHPRALYFTDDCYVGWVPGGLVEIAAIDPRLGPIFYSFDPRAVSAAHPPEFDRKNDCLRCHGSHFVPGIPSVFARSLYVQGSGEPLYRQGDVVVDYRTPFTNRWGGWYVTGLHGNIFHRGNSFASEKDDALVFNAAAGANVTNLASYFDAQDYLTNTADIVSLLVFEHQMAMQNALTRAGNDCRSMLDYQSQLLKAFKETATNDEPRYDSVRHVFDHAADDVVDCLLFKDEADLPDGIAGSAEFQKAFAANARRAADGSSLKDLLISDHLFKNRCSYLIYSDSFLSLPRPLKARIYTRLAKALAPQDPDPRYNYLHESERRRIATILHETHPEFRNAQFAKK
jgi:hypothetical protein